MPKYWVRLCTGNCFQTWLKGNLVTKFTITLSPWLHQGSSLCGLVCALDFVKFCHCSVIPLAPLIIFWVVTGHWHGYHQCLSWMGLDNSNKSDLITSGVLRTWELMKILVCELNLQGFHLKQFQQRFSKLKWFGNWSTKPLVWPLNVSGLCSVKWGSMINPRV